MMRETTILVPITCGDDPWPQLESRLTEIAGGFTLLGETRGKWIDHHGNEHTDHCRMYAVANISQQDLADAVSWIKSRWHQEAIYVRHAAASII